MADPIHDVLQVAARCAGGPQPASIEQVTVSLRASLRRVRPVWPVWGEAVLVAFICVVVGIAGAALLGPGGLYKLHGGEIAWLFPLLGAFVAAAALLAVREMRPGHSRLLPAGWLMAIITGAVVAAFAVVFHTPGWVRFFAQGLICLKAGLMFALIAAVVLAAVLRRGYAVDPSAAGLLAGTLAGFAGVTMLELHCTDFQAQHVLIWHVAVLPCSALIGLLAGRLLAAISRR